MKTVADWIQVKLHEKGMAAYQLGEKMGIASSLLNAWKNGVARPKAVHMQHMVRILGKLGRNSIEERRAV